MKDEISIGMNSNENRPVKTEIDLHALIDVTETLGREMDTPKFTQIYQNKTKITDYKIISNLAKGGYGEVFVGEKNGQIFAIKRINKATIKNHPNSAFFMTEKEIMTQSNSPWLVQCLEALQDDVYLYFVMKFIGGGDLMGLLSKRETIDEEEIAFYASEIAHALNELHKLGFIHRDLKPDNVFINTNGHITLGDFGCAAKLVNGKTSSSVPVGTPDYVSCDLLLGEDVLYGCEVDFWTLGVIIYEMVEAEPPFFSDSLKETYRRISLMEFKKPENISPELSDLFDKLIVEKEKRLDFEGIKKHPFFKKINWDDLQSQTPPFVPDIKDEADISNFVDVNFKPDDSTTKGGYKDFIGFTFDPKYVKTFGEYLFKIPTGKELDTGENKQKQLDLVIEGKMMEIDDLNLTVTDISKEIEIRRQETKKLALQLTRTVNEMLLKKEELEELVTEIDKRQEELVNLNQDISAKSELLEGKSQGGNIFAHEMVRDLQRLIQRSKINETISELRNQSYSLYKENERLQQELEISTVDLSEGGDSVDLKKQLRIYKTEIKEYQQRIDQEIAARKNVEQTLQNFRKSAGQMSMQNVSLQFSVSNSVTNIPLVIKIEQSIFTYNGKEYPMNCIHVRDAKPHEYHHFPYKKKALTLIIHFLKENTGSVRSCPRRSWKNLQADLSKEQEILKGIDELGSILSNTAKIDVEIQRTGTLKRIEQIQAEIQLAEQSSVDRSDTSDDQEKVYEFNNHLFKEFTVAKGTLCDYCCEVLFGTVNQAYHCNDCMMTVHKTCFVQVETSCELQKAINRGKKVAVVCRSIEEKEKFLKAFVF